MAPGYEWVFGFVYATIGLGTPLMIYTVVLEMRGRRGDKREHPRRPRPPRQVF